MAKTEGKKRGKYRSYNPKKIQEIIENVCGQYETGEYTIQSCCRSVGVSYRTFASWFTKYENFGEYIPDEWKYFAEFAEMYRVTKLGVNNVHREILIEKAETSLEKRVVGYEYEERITEVEKQVDKYGNEVLIPVKIKKVVKCVPPSLTAIQFVLKKFKPEEYGDKNTIVHLKSNKGLYNDLTLEQIEDEISKLES